MKVIKETIYCPLTTGTLMSGKTCEADNVFPFRNGPQIRDDKFRDVMHYIKPGFRTSDLALNLNSVQLFHACR